MNLTLEQQRAIDKGEAVPITVDGRECVVIRRDVYEQVKSFAHDEVDPEEAYPMIESILEDDPALDSYRRYKK
jgi:hypothetical protein